MQRRRLRRIGPKSIHSTAHPQRSRRTSTPYILSLALPPHSHREPHHTTPQGAAAFLLCYVLTSLGLLLKMGGRPQKYLPISWLGFLFADAANHVLSFLLFWCMAYTLVHIY